MPEADKISLENISKKFNNTFIIKDFSYDFKVAEYYVITGPNGSGKSTLVQLISGHRALSSGTINFFSGGKKIDENLSYKSISFAAPYQELIEDFKLEEIINFHFKLKKFRAGISPEKLIKNINLEKHKNKLIKNFSSGMQQRLKLGLAIFAESSFLFLDEPTSNLDNENIDWYKETIKNNLENRAVIVCSNKNEDEYFFCDKEINIMDYKY